LGAASPNLPGIMRRSSLLVASVCTLTLVALALVLQTRDSGSGHSSAAQDASSAAQDASSAAQDASSAAQDVSSAVQDASSAAQDASAISAAMANVISASFANVRGAGAFLPSNVYKGELSDQYLVQTMCLTGERASYDLAGMFETDALFQKQIAQLGIDKYCDPRTGEARDDPTCLALGATLDAFVKLDAQFPGGPAFVNFSLYAWANSSSPEYATSFQRATDKTLVYTGPWIESWVKGSVTFAPQQLVNGIVTAPSAKVHVPAGASAFAMCDLVRTVLTQDNEQQSANTCGPSALFNALSLRAPARALRLGLELLWTGTLPFLPARPCAYIRAQLPGLAGPESKYTPSGIEHAWTMSLQSATDAAILGTCDDDAQHMLFPYNLTVAKNPRAESKATTTLGVMLPWCDWVLGSCEFLYNYTYNTGGFMTAARWLDFQTAEGKFTTFIDIIEAKKAPDLWNNFPYLRAHPRVQKMRDTQAAALAASSFASEKEGLGFMGRQGLPSVTADNVKAACARKVALVQISMFMFSNLGATACPGCTCNHWALLESCDAEKDEYILWSWGSQYPPVKLAWLQAGVCGFLVSNMTVA
jgi:hypothetical protein